MAQALSAQRARWRYCLVPVALFAAVFAYYHGRARPAQLEQLRGRREAVVRWEKARLPAWKALSYVELSEAARVEDRVRAAVSGSGLLARLSGEQRGAFTTALVQVLSSLGAPDADTYLDRIQPLRKLRPTPGTDQHLRASFRLMSGSSFDDSSTAARLLREFWGGADAITPRCTWASIGGAGGVVFSLSEWAGHGDERWEHDATWSEQWANEASTSFVRVTLPPISTEELIARDGRVLRVSVNLVVRNEEAHYVPVYLGFAWDPKAGHWTFQDAFMQTDERLYWPI